MHLLCKYFSTPSVSAFHLFQQFRTHCTVPVKVASHLIIVSNDIFFHSCTIRLYKILKHADLHWLCKYFSTSSVSAFHLFKQFRTHCTVPVKVSSHLITVSHNIISIHAQYQSSHLSLHLFFIITSINPANVHATILCLRPMPYLRLGTLPTGTETTSPMSPQRVLSVTATADDIIVLKQSR